MKARNVLLYFSFTLYFFLIGHNSFAQNLAIKVNPATCQTIGAPIVLSDIVEIDGPNNDLLEGLQITVTENFEEDSDLFTYTFGDNIQGEFDANNGIFTLSGQATIAQYREALNRLFFTSTTVSFDQKTINITMSGVDFLVETGHFYQFFPQAGISWDAADAASQNQELFGLKGYLTTITTSSENKFILDRVSGTAWIGASDREQEGVWRWVTGPEGLEDLGRGRLLNQGFTNWNDGEPNNSGDEDYAHMMDWSTPPGRWNDLRNEGAPPGQYHPTGYIVEYGGMPGDPDIISQISGTTIIDWQRDIEVTGSTSVCPNIEGVPYNATALDAHSYFWSIEGGIIIGGQGTDEILVKWGDTNPNAKVSVEVTSDLACVYNSELNVKINEQLEPPLPVGDSFVCFADLNTPQKYSTPFTPGSDYEWKPTNGTVVSGQGTNEVEILWDAPGVGSIYFTESTRTATDICDGDSPVLTIDLREEIITSFELDHVKCNGGNDGMAKVIVSTPGTLISYEWIVPPTAQINQDEVSNLEAGLYSVWVTVDDCRVEFPFEITEPDELAESNRILTNVLCFGQSNGTASFDIVGGTLPYTYKWSHDPQASGNSVSNLPKGDHSLEIIDANNCQLILNFEITEPDLLVVDEIISTLVSCPGGSDGTLEAIVSGGTGAYSYEWEYSPDTESLATGFPKGEYRVIVTDENGCQATLTQTVEEAIPIVVLPNAFTPNNDGKNDTFGPTTPCDIEFRMEVYNRWGQVIFSTNSSIDHWDGTFNGTLLPLGSYSFSASWVIVANDLVIRDGKSGEVQLLN